MNCLRLVHRRRRSILVSRCQRRVRPALDGGTLVHKNKRWRPLLQGRWRKTDFALLWPHRASMIGFNSPLLHQGMTRPDRDTLVSGKA